MGITKISSGCLLLLMASCYCIQARQQILLLRPQQSVVILSLRGGSDREDYYYNYNENPKRRNAETMAGTEDQFYSYPEEQEQPQQDRYYQSDRGYEDRGYDDRGTEPLRQRPAAATESLQKMSKLLQHGNRSIGVPMLAAGAVFTLLGVSLFFNKSLLRLGNLLFIMGVPMTIGPGRTAGYFFQPKKSRATACLVVGIFLVLIGWPVFGMVLEVFGILNLFGNMFPIVTAMLKTMPVIGPLLKGQSGGGGGGGRSRRRRDFDEYDDDGRRREEPRYYEGGEDRQRYDESRDRDGHDSYY